MATRLATPAEQAKINEANRVLNSVNLKLSVNEYVDGNGGAVVPNKAP